MDTANRDPRVCGTGMGTAWLGEGWRLFAFSPGLWMVLVVVLFFVFLALGIVPFIGFLLGQLIAPALAGGVLLAARDAEAGRPLDLGRLFEPLTREDTRGDILILGLLYLGGFIAASVLGMIVMLLLVGSAAINAGAFADPANIDAATTASIGIGVAIAVLIWMLLGLLVTVLFFYAIPLVVLGGLSPIHALTRGVRGLLINWKPLLILGLVWTVLAILATVPLGLGWLLLAPVTYGAWYASYRDIFEAAAAQQAPAAEYALEEG